MSNNMLQYKGDFGQLRKFAIRRDSRFDILVPEEIKLS